MEFYRIVKHIAVKQKLTQEEICRRMGRSKRYLSANMARKSIPKVDSAAAIAKACGYELCVVPADEVPESAFVIDAKRDPNELLG